MLATLKFATDGLVEAHPPEGEMSSFPRLRALITERAEERSLGDFLLEELYSFVGEGWVQENDITRLTLRRSWGESRFLCSIMGRPTLDVCCYLRAAKRSYMLP
jgi:hypothetical protein